MHVSESLNSFNQMRGEDRDWINDKMEAASSSAIDSFVLFGVVACCWFTVADYCCPFS